ncbi:DNA ligase 4 [Episyrphus balteatus]|uniref:DNA ligase 4 n=1 Tax=Episyrphus balteatus TaxID=286459 RepID=UPI00248583FE|nr:DNA ligase 4 [Episyrphus balteatus]
MSIISKSVKFFELCQKFEKIKTTEGIAQKEQKLHQTLTSFLDFTKEFRRNNGDDNNSNFYCLLRCLLPDSDNARDSYGIQITTLGRIYIKILQLPPGGSDALKLLHRSPNNGQHGDYADIVYGVLKTRTSNTPSDLKLFDIHAMLDTISSEDRKSVENILTKLSETASAFEQKWFIRLLLKRMNLGIGEARIFSMLHPKAKEYFARCSDLEKVCIAIERGDEMCLEKTIAPFSHVRPMLCERLKTECLYTMMGNDTLYAETKMDGERFQLHKQDETFKYISRNGVDYTKYFGSNQNEGNLTPLVVGLMETFVKSVILDGEMMVWDKETESYRVKGENFDVKHLQVGGNLRPCFVAYDLIYLNGKSYTEKSYAERVDKMKTCFREQAGVLQLGKRTKLCTLQHFMDIFNEALDANEEGVVIKMHRSKYAPGSRTGGWFKVKADYIKDLVADMDMLIMGGYYNRTKTYVNSYLVGVIQGDENDAKLHCVGKVAIGLSASERTTLNSNLASKWKKGFIPKTLCFGHLSPDVWIEPKDSIVLKLKASELGQASSFATPYSLRFPRIEEIRSDKPWFECMTLKEYEDFYQGDHGVKKINKRALNEQDISSRKKPRTSTSRTKTSTTVYSNNFNWNDVSVESSLFEDFNFCILSSVRGSEQTLNKLKELVVKNGGNIVENPSPTDYKCICIAGDITYRVEKLCQTGNYNVVSCNWLVDTAERKRMQLKPRDMISSTAELREQLKDLFDANGDSYTDHLDVNELQCLLAELDSNALPLLQEHEMTALEEDIYGENKSPNFFRNTKAFFYSPDDKGTLTHASTIAKLTFQWRGGACPDVQTLDGEKKIRYVFANLKETDMNALEMWFLVTFTKRLLKVKVVSIDWITNSDKEGKRLPIDNYLINF